MKVIATLVMLLLTANVFASQVEVDFVPQTNSTTFQILLQKPVKKAPCLGVFAYQLSSKAWSEGYAGLTYAPVPQVEVALGYGLEEAPDSGRLGGWIWAGKGRVSAFYLFEDGGSGPWHKLEAKYRLTDRLTAGYVERTYSGKGLLVERRLQSEKFRIYCFENQTEISLIHTF